MQILRETKLESLKKAKEIGRESALQILEKKGLVGRGGAAFPTAKKWRMALNVKSKTRYLICNADEGEPGTFKDRFILKNNPETFIEGILVAAFILDVKKCFIYLRGEYNFLRKDLEEKISELLKKSKMKIKIDIVRGSGAYICGEETAIIQSIMGFRGNAMQKPPYPTIKGLWGKPTVINNVETLTCVAQALFYNDWNPNIRLFSISGDVEHPGLYEWELGVKISTILDTVKPENGKVKAMSFGCFGGIMPVKKTEAISSESICKNNCHHGAFTIIFIGEDKNILDMCLSISKFYTYESCGKCTPCREGTIRILNLLKKIRDKRAIKEDLNFLKDLANHIQETSLCGLGQSCGNHVLTAMNFFREDFEKFLK
ncbi:MAG: NADH-ubiquinone oxidoreductase-F iron-sulfur binding region domain-containing protein [Candidatus Pacearchaeota archaeon]